MKWFFPTSHLFGKGNWLVRSDQLFPVSSSGSMQLVVLSDLDLFLANILAMCLHTVGARQIPFALIQKNIYIAQLMLFKLILMIGLLLTSD